MKPKIVVFASGSGSNFKAIAEAIHNQTLDAQIVGLIYNRPEIGALKIAKNFGIPTYYLNDKDFPNYEEYELRLLNILKTLKPDLIALAGYLRKIPKSVTNQYTNQILNIHPSLLPKYGGAGYYGIKVHEAVIQNDEKESGCTVHLVNEAYDEGAIIEQVKVPVMADDTPEILAKRVLKEEHQLYPKVIKNYLTQILKKS